MVEVFNLGEIGPVPYFSRFKFASPGCVACRSSVPYSALLSSRRSNVKGLAIPVDDGIIFQLQSEVVGGYITSRGVAELKATTDFWTTNWRVSGCNGQSPR